LRKIFVLKKNKRYNFTSKYIVKLYKKCLSFKLLFCDNMINQPNLILSKNPLIPVYFVKCIYARRERVPFRLLRFFSLLNTKELINFGVKYLIATRLSVYNGCKKKFINIKAALLELTIRCSFRFGDLIFTRARYK
jgi:hypothetical protein